MRKSSSHEAIISLDDLKKLTAKEKALLALVGFLLFGGIMFFVLTVLDHEAIHDAARTGDVKRVEAILDRSPERLEQRNRLGLTPLHVAAWEGQPEVIELLIRRG